MRTKKKPLLLTKADLSDLAPRLEKWADDWPENDDSGLYCDAYQGLVTAFGASAALAGEPSHLAAFVSLCRDGGEWPGELAATCARSAIRLAGADPARRRLAASLAENRWNWADWVLAAWLDPGDPGERAVLESFLDGHSGEDVAKRARERLESAGAVPWWQGRFAADPAAGLAGDEATKALVVLREFLAMLEKPKPTPDEERRMLAQVRSLPPRAAQLCARAVVEFDGWGGPSRPGYLALMLERPEGVERFTQLLADTEDMLSIWVRETLKEALPSLAPQCREALALALLGRVRDCSWDKVTGFREPEGKLFDACLDVWPEQTDPAPVVGALRRWASRESATGHTYRSGEFFKRMGPAWPSLQETMRESFACEWGGEHTLLGPALAHASECWPALRRELALDLLARSTNGAMLGWAAPVVVAEDEAAALKLLGDPRVRGHLFENLRGAVFLQARRELNAGRLTLEEADAVFSHVGTHAGGVVTTMPHLGLGEDDVDPAEPWNTREDRGEWLAGLAGAETPDLAGPPTPAEWEQYRRLREPTPCKPRRFQAFGLFVPPGPWLAEDLAWMETMVRHSIDADPDLAIGLARVFSLKPSVESLRLCERLEKVVEERAVEFFEPSLKRLRSSLGVAVDAGGTAEAGGGSSGADDW